MALDPRPIDIVADSSGRWHAVYDAIRCIFGSSTEFCLARVFSSVFKESEDLIQARHGVSMPLPT
jgi:hypothetical protein